MISYIAKFLIVTLLLTIVGCSSLPSSEYGEKSEPTCYLIMPVYNASQQSFILVNLGETPPSLK